MYKMSEMLENDLKNVCYNLLEVNSKDIWFTITWQEDGSKCSHLRGRAEINKVKYILLGANEMHSGKSKKSLTEVELCGGWVGRQKL